jgi:hypothetical protein
MTKRQVIAMISEIFKQQPLDQDDWNRSSEALLKYLSDVLEERDKLLDAYLALYGDLRAAEGKVTLLEAQLASLRAERNDTPEHWRSPMVLTTIALCVMTAIGPILGVITDHHLKAAADKVVAQAQVVQKDCNISITNNNITVTPPPPPAQSGTYGSGTYGSGTYGDLGGSSR